MAVRCPAKVNLGLRVLSRRSDGYHELRTVFQAIDLWDRIEGGLADGLTLVCDDPRVPTDETNLVLRAARALQRRAGERRGASLSLVKRIPAGGGLGGGSSDAAGTLVLLNRLWGHGLSRAELVPLAAGLGADVPFFLYGGTALGRDRGDRVEPTAPAAGLPLVLGIPPFGVSTGDVYRRFDALRQAAAPRGEPARNAAATALTPPANDVSLTRLLALKLPPGNDFGIGVNDLERVVFDRWPDLRGFRDDLLRVGARSAMLSGSGSTVFGIFRAREASAAARALATRYPDWTVQTSRLLSGGPRLVGPCEDTR